MMSVHDPTLLRAPPVVMTFRWCVLCFLCFCLSFFVCFYISYVMLQFQMLFLIVKLWIIVDISSFDLILRSLNAAWRPYFLSLDIVYAAMELLIEFPFLY